MKTFIFDLDMTLLNTAKLASLRMSRNWDEVGTRLGDVTAFEVDGVKVHEIPKELSNKGYKIGIVTNSPKWYAEKLIEMFGIYTDVIVGYGDTEKHKPDPEALNHALGLLNVSGDTAYHIGDTWTDNKAAYLAGMVSIGAGWGRRLVREIGYHGKSPDIYLLDPSKLLNPDSLLKRGYIGEVFCMDMDVIYHKGSKIKSGENPKSFALGRYYKTVDPRREKSEFSKRILNFKNNDDHAEFFARCTARFLNKQTWKPDVITYVPSKPDEEYDRFKIFLEILSNGLLDFEVSYRRDILVCREKIENYKELSSTEREEKLLGTYAAEEDIRGKVLVIDDVQSSGSTARETSRALLEAGSTEVRMLTFGLNQHPPFEKRACPDCGMSLRVLTSRYGVDFWGCSGWKGYDNPDSCKFSESISF